MLGKLIKHDFRALSRILWPVQLCVLGATILATLGIRFGFADTMGQSALTGGVLILRTVSSIVSALLIAAIFASMIVVLFIIIQQFYRSCLCSEGYLTFTLPTTPGRILWSKLITAMLWLLISFAVLFVCLLIFLAFGTSSNSFYNAEAIERLFSALSHLFTSYGANLVLPTIEFILLLLVGTASSLLCIFLALTLGAVCARQHKVLAAIGFFFAIGIVVSIISTTIQMTIGANAILYLNDLYPLLDEREFFNSGAMGVAQSFLLYNLALSSALGAIYYIGTWQLMKKKLNLD